jgi:hypothetical protein
MLTAMTSGHMAGRVMMIWVRVAVSKKRGVARCQWLTPVILTTWEAYMRRITYQGQPWKIAPEIPFPK